MQFKIDENLPLRLRNLLMENGFKAETVFEEGISGEPDKMIFDYCQRENLILITLDLDFGNIRAYPLGTHPGIIVLKLKKQSAKAVTQAFKRFLSKAENLRKLAGCIVIIEENKFRIRKEGS
jgi:predicted nuclease of predicted toxin-antitoxin system